VACELSEAISEHVEFLDLRERLADEVQDELVIHLQALAINESSVSSIRSHLTTIGCSRTESRPNDPLGLALLGAARSKDLEELLMEARNRLPV
jgi:hypothetical protein